MDFLDEAVITACSGDGGQGCVSFRRERFIPRGGPDGGDGGDGGNIILRATKKLFTLTDFKPRKLLRARNGEPGKGKDQTGKRGADLILRVPVGTVVQDEQSGETLADLASDNQEILIISGGKGGKGNKHFATSTNRAPRYAQPGRAGQEKRLKLSLKFLADIGLVGLPNVGKSTLLSRLTTARPKIDSYPFTTLIPNLGVMVLDDDHHFVIADIPGLIEGASDGRGLGHRFLKHIERTKLILHLVDITYEPKNDLLEDFHMVGHEIDEYGSGLDQKRQMILINKMDLYTPKHRDVKEIQEAFRRLGLESLPISALTGQGLNELKAAILKNWGSLIDGAHH